MIKILKTSLLFSLLYFTLGCQNSAKKKENPKKTEKQRFLDSLDKVNLKAASYAKSNISKLYISPYDSIAYWPGFCCDQYRVFGYEKPNLNSKKILLISFFNNDVKGNPFELKYGAYHNIYERNDFKLKFIGFEKDFAKVNFIKFNKNQGSIYFEKKWVEFEIKE